MDEHHCLLCMGSNTNRYAQLSVAREALRATFPDIHFGEMMETEAVGSGFHLSLIHISEPTRPY